ncbi:MAG: hypothetical protein DCC75_11715 [Proteobacteria bacterium]|nr:MAG: hypothetical protein DCC75_11715 [Pseudomonadota bacterium]
MKLAELQDKFSRYLEGADGKAVSLGLEGACAEGRLQIYKDLSHAALINALLCTFKAVSRYLGRSSFLEVAKRYAAKYSSRLQNLDNYGENLPEHIHENFASDLARLDWLFAQSYFNSTTSEFPSSEFLKLPEAIRGDVILQLNPSLYLMQSSWPLHRYYPRLLAGESCGKPLEAQKTWLVICCQRAGPEATSANESTYRFIELMKSEISLEEVARELGADRLAEALPLGECISQRWITGYKVGA